MKRIYYKLREILGRGPQFKLSTFRLDQTTAEARVGSSDLETIFLSGNGRSIHKWVDYLPIYERLFAPYRNRPETHPVTMIEIGVYEGGSLDLWRQYFGAEAKIFGIDINPDCKTRVDEPNQVRIGSQDDPEFLARLVAETGPPDIILDDGSHIGRHQKAAFQSLWPALNDGGLYVIEDLHTAYWPRFEGGYRKSGTAIEVAKTLVDDMHAWFHPHGEQLVPKDEIGAILFFESIVAIEKRSKQRPGHLLIQGRQTTARSAT